MSLEQISVNFRSHLIFGRPVDIGTGQSLYHIFSLIPGFVGRGVWLREYHSSFLYETLAATSLTFCLFLRYVRLTGLTHKML